MGERELVAILAVLDRLTAAELERLAVALRYEQRERAGGRVSYRQEFVKCGRKGCKCASGVEADMHGPYWYAYTFENGKLKKRYVGKTLTERGEQ